MHYNAVIKFWFEEISPGQWWKKSAHFDRLIREKFLACHEHASRGELFEWRQTALGRLAEIIVLDQFSRNIYRDQPLAFTCDTLALSLARQGITADTPQQLHAKQRAFLYMPFMHSESANIQKISVTLFSKPGLKANLSSALRHKNIIDQFGRFPHRNQILGRPSTAAESNFLQQPASSF